MKRRRTRSEKVKEIAARLDGVLGRHGFTNRADTTERQRLQISWIRDSEWRRDEISLVLKHRGSDGVFLNVEVFVIPDPSEFIQISGTNVPWAAGKPRTNLNFPLTEGFLPGIFSLYLTRIERVVLGALTWIDENFGTPQKTLALVESIDMALPPPKLPVCVFPETANFDRVVAFLRNIVARSSKTASASATIQTP